MALMKEVAVNVTLRKSDRHNFRECVKLKVAEGQTHFVAPNVFSIAQAYADPECVPLAIYDGEVMVGFAMYALDTDEQKWWIYRLMVDVAQQGKGYGRAAMVELMRLIGELPGGNEIAISYEPENEVARKLYASLGFVETGEVVGNETIARYNRHEV